MVFKTNQMFFAELSRWEQAVAEKHTEFTKKLSASRKEKGRRRSVCKVLWEFVSEDANTGEYIFLVFDTYKVSPFCDSLELLDVDSLKVSLCNTFKLFVF